MATSIFESRNYKNFIKQWLSDQPKRGRGILVRMSEHARMSQGMMSQVLNGDKNFSMEAANEIAAFMALSEEESEYFLLLVNYERAGTPSLRERLNKKILQEQKKANEIGKKLKPDQEFSEMAKTLVFSHWIYTGIWNMTACANFSDVDSIAAHLKLSRIHVQKAVDFLLKTGLCVKKNGRLSVGPQVLHIGNETSLVGKHHQNWRLHGITKMFEQNESDVFFTCPLSLSREAAELIRWKIPTFIEEIRNIVGPSPSEVVRCVNIDWFAF